ncbi:MAG: hypothetical protein ABI574_02875 [Burkholderiales bacterium]
MRTSLRPAGIGLVMCIAGVIAPGVAHAQSGIATGLSWSGELQTSWRDQRASATGPLAAANSLQPGLAAVPGSSWLNRAELTGGWQPKGSRYALASKLLLESSQAEQGGSDRHARVNELHASADWGAWQGSAGKKIVAWDVGYAWRPNDVVQQEQRRQLLPVTPEGRPVLMLEHFSAESAATLVMVHPQRWAAASANERGPEEAALAGRWYQRVGAADWHAFARLGEHSRASLGGALAWVATDALELHASARALQKHDALVSEAGAAAAPQAGNPWRLATQGSTQQWLIGASWSGQAQQSLLVELWHDGTAPSNAQWADWRQRNAGLLALGTQSTLWRSAAAGNLAWQAEALGGSRANLITSNLRRDNAYLRASWQPSGGLAGLPGTWTLAADALITPADRGHAIGASLQWQGDRWRIDAAWRRYGGPADALYAQLPVRSSGVVAATYGF